MYYVKHKSSERQRVIRRAHFTITFLLLMSLLVGVSVQMRRVMGNIASIQAQNRYAMSVSSALSGLVSDESFDIIHINSAGTGEITSLETDTGQLNRLRADLTAKLLEELGKSSDRPMYVSLGSLTGIELLAGLGPQIEFRAELSGGLSVDVSSSFIETGINQSMHSIVCTVTADYYIILPGCRFKTTLSQTVPLAESIIVGEVPDADTYVVGDQSDTIGRIFDYGAGQ